MFLVATPLRLPGHIMGGAGFGLVVASADGEQASPVNLGVLSGRMICLRR